MFETMELGPVPANEECEQLGRNYEPSKARNECKAFINQLTRIYSDQLDEFGPDVYFKITSNAHDFGTYYEVAVRFNEDSEEATRFAYDIEGNCPTEWDDIARRELGLVS